MNKSILDVVHEGVKDLHQAGVMKDVTLREFDALCLPPVKELSPVQIKRIRTRLKASQNVFAMYLNTSVSTIQKWEQGKKHPNGISLKLLNIVDEKGLEVLS
jgi:putative transcriptional regulator